jgi:ribosomal protein L37AE/L43A
MGRIGLEKWTAMLRVACPVCSQGWVVPAKAAVDRTPIWVCQECEVVWFGVEDPAGPPDDTLSTFLESRGRKPLWSELEVVE